MRGRGREQGRRGGSKGEEKKAERLKSSVSDLIITRTWLATEFFS